MVLATILQCAIVGNVIVEPNAAHAWRDYFKQIEDVEIPRVDQGEWTDECQKWYEEFSPLIQRAREIAAIPHCDWELDYSQGFDMLLPEISQLRDAQHLIRFSIQGDIVAGNTTFALEGVQSLLEVTHHHNTTKTVIGALVTDSSFNMATKGNEHLVDSSNDVVQLEKILETVDAFDEFDPFGIRASIGHERDSLVEWMNTSPSALKAVEAAFEEEFDTSTWNMQEEVANYTAVMDKMETVFQLSNEAEATAAANNLMEEVAAGEHGMMANLLCPTLDRLLEISFESSEDLALFKQLVQQKIEMLQSPNAATYFLQAVEAYAAIDPDTRTEAVATRDFELLDEPLQLLAKAAAMEPARITLTDEPATPHWIAPLHALTMDAIARGTAHDVLVAFQVVGHLSQQDRFAASIAAATIFRANGDVATEWQSTSFQEEILDAIAHIPAADIFMLHGSSKSELRRLYKWFDLEEKWEPPTDVVLAATLTLARVQGAPDVWPNVWSMFVDSLRVPDDDSVVTAAVVQFMPDALLYVELDQSQEFNEMVRSFRNLLAKPRHTTTRPRGQ